MIIWKEFLTGLGILTLIYYLVVIIKYYRFDIIARLKGKLSRSAEADGRENSEDKTPELFTATEKAIAALTASLQDSLVKGADREAAISSLKNVLGNYAYLKGTPYAIAVHHFLLRETNQSVRLNEAEVKGLWD